MPPELVADLYRKLLYSQEFPYTSKCLQKGKHLYLLYTVSKSSKPYNCRCPGQLVQGSLALAARLFHWAVEQTFAASVAS